MLDVDSLTLLLTDTDWTASPSCEETWQIDLGSALARLPTGQRLRLSLLGGVQRLSWSSASTHGELTQLSGTQMLQGSIALEPSSRSPVMLVLRVEAKNPPLVTYVHVVRGGHGASSETLPCARRPTAAVVSSPLSIDDLLAMTHDASDPALIENIARALLVGDSSNVCRLQILQLLARVAYNCTPDGLIDLMVHLGSGNRN